MGEREKEKACGNMNCQSDDRLGFDEFRSPTKTVVADFIPQCTLGSPESGRTRETEEPLPGNGWNR